MKTSFIMQEKVNNIAILIEKFLEEDLSHEEERKLNEWLREDENNRLFFEQITNKQVLKEKLKIYSTANSEDIWEKTLKKINAVKVMGIPKRKTFKIPNLGLTRWFTTILQHK
ncbi:hypothetical protein A3860_17770 [Niastella vici]|uniref:Uncharacterized protein n=1 Tax=Niastella vici TaxID=1703345 RepID=A0A1V9G4G1_9BACT|nr:hypothetical protein [Niastella vici]OQP65513.1 hypothetical protein A3860_17770 [Niastella vici]